MKKKNAPNTLLSDLTPTQERAVQTILNLRLLTENTGTITTRAQNSVLRGLNDVDLAAVANVLALLSTKVKSSPTVAVESRDREDDTDGNRK